MIADERAAGISLVTIVGLTLLLGPLMTMAHEIGGHMASCIALGGAPREIGAYYVDCTGTGPLARRLVAMAGTAMDLLVALACFLLWRSARGDMARLVLWLVFSAKAMVAAGYWLFSGASGIGDWGPGADGGIGPLPSPMLWRFGLFVMGFFAYVAIVRLSRVALGTMLGGGEKAQAGRKRIALGFYVVNGLLAVLIGLINPQGLFITLASAAASTFGGTAGMLTIAYGHATGRPRPFAIRRNVPILIAGLVVAGLFGTILGPGLKI